MEATKVRQPPQGLQPRGRTLWRDVLATYTLTPTEIELLRSLCNAVDQIHRVELRMKAEHVTSTGSSGQLTGHPLLHEWRQHAEMIRSLTRQLNLPDIDRKEPKRKPKMNPGKVSHLMGGA
jgi:hypothetical protein